MAVNKTLLNMTMPTKLNIWYNKLVEAIKKYYEQEGNKNYLETSFNKEKDEDSSLLLNKETK